MEDDFNFGINRVSDCNENPFAAVVKRLADCFSFFILLNAEKAYEV